MASADPRQFGNSRFEQADRTFIVACGKRPDAATELDRAAAHAAGVAYVGVGDESGADVSISGVAELPRLLLGAGTDPHER